MKDMINPSMEENQNLRKALELILRQSVQLQADAIDFAAQMEAIGEQHESVWKGIDAQIAAIQEHSESQWKDMNERIRGALARVRDMITRTGAKAEAIGMMGWTVPMHATPGEYEHLVDGISDISSADIAFGSYYAGEHGVKLKDLQDELLACNKLQQWKPVVEEAILDLEDERYRSCIALLLPLVEGVTAITFSKPQFHRKDERDKFFAQKLQGVGRGSMAELVWRSYKGFAEALYAYVDFHASEKPAFLNRHYILHGRGIADSNLTDCLRLLQALHTLTALA